MSSEPRRAGCSSSCRRRRARARRPSCEQLVRDVPGIAMSRSYTSRPPRPGEADGVDYNFISRERFVAMIASRRSARTGRGLRHLLRHRRGGHRARLAGGDDLVLVIDVQGARKVRARGHRARRHLRAAAVLCGPRGAAPAAQQGLRGTNPAPAGGRAGGGRTPSRSTTTSSINDEVDGGVDRLRAIVEAERSRLAVMQRGPTRSSRASGPGHDGRDPGTADPERAERGTPDHRTGTARMSLIALGVTGGIGAYKAVEVARGLQKRGHDVVAS